jgi:hypothetical protein
MAIQLNTAPNPPVASATSTGEPARKSPIRTWEATTPIAVALILALLPALPGLPHFAWTYFSIFAGVIVGLLLEPQAVIDFLQQRAPANGHTGLCLQFYGPLR